MAHLGSLGNQTKPCKFGFDCRFAEALPPLQLPQRVSCRDLEGHDYVGTQKIGTEI